jgi:hypothetical protein
MKVIRLEEMRELIESIKQADFLVIDNPMDNLKKWAMHYSEVDTEDRKLIWKSMVVDITNLIEKYDTMFENIIKKHD